MNRQVGLKALITLRTWAITAICGYILFSGFFTLWLANQILSLIPDIWPFNLQHLNMANWGLFLLTALPFCMWIFRAHAMLRDAGKENLAFSPGWAVGWYFVPLANLYKPFQAMCELYNRTIEEEISRPTIVARWWCLWIGGPIISIIQILSTQPFTAQPSSIAFMLGIGLCEVGAAIYTIKVIDEITKAQKNLAALPDTFT